jgi:tetratricopeptide (TPR) repeat protein
VSVSARLGRALLPALLALSSSAAARAETPPLDSARWTRLAAESWLERAQARARRGDTAEAITAYTEALRIDPRSGVACLELAELRLALGDSREAERLYSQATRISEVRAEALTRRAHLYLAQRRSDLGLLDLQAAVATEPSLPRLRELASYYVKQRAWVAALAIYRKLHASLPAQASPSEIREAEDTLAALSALSAEADGVQHDMAELDWVRRALRHLSRAPQKPLPDAGRAVGQKGSVPR